MMACKGVGWVLRCGFAVGAAVWMAAPTWAGETSPATSPSATEMEPDDPLASNPIILEMRKQQHVREDRLTAVASTRDAYRKAVSACDPAAVSHYAPAQWRAAESARGDAEAAEGTFNEAMLKNQPTDQPYVLTMERYRWATLMLKQAVDVAEVAAKQAAEVVRPPQRIVISSRADFDAYAFFDQDRKPKAWYYRGEGGRLELFDRPGVHPTFGAELQPVTPDVVRELSAGFAKADAATAARAEMLQARTREAGPSYRVGDSVRVEAKVVKMSPAFDPRGETLLATLDGKMRVRVLWEDCPPELKRYFGALKRREGNTFVLSGKIKESGEGSCSLRVEDWSDED